MHGSPVDFLQSRESSESGRERTQVMTHTNPNRARAHYANMALQATTLAAIDALRAVLNCPHRNSSREFGAVCVAAHDALERYDAATVEMFAAMFAEDSQ